MGRYIRNKIKYEKKAGYRTINSKISVILNIWEPWLARLSGLSAS